MGWDVSGPFAAAIRDRARRARAALETARQEDDPEALIVAEGEWDDVTRVAREHDIELGPDDEVAE